MKEIIVAKFGGTSMADAEAMRRSAQISLNHEADITVVSATSGTTNQVLKLVDTAQNASSWEEADQIVQEMSDRHFEIANQLELSEASLEQVRALLKEAKTLARGINLLKDCSAKTLDSILSVGERLSSLLFTECLNQISGDNKVIWFDIRQVMRTDDHYGRAVPQIQEIERLAQLQLTPYLEQGIKIVTQGFIGQTEEGITTTLGRGGSDYSAALIAEAVNASTLQIWTDVAGIASTDPRICPKASPISEIGFSEAAELAAFGAKILHPATLWPAVRKNIPVFVGSSYEADKKGTWIRSQVENAPLVRAMAIRENQSLLTLSTPKMLHSHSFLYEVFRVFNQHKTSVDAITTSEISVSLTIEDGTLNNKALLRDLRTLCDVKVEEHQSLVSLIGNNINHTAGLAKEIFHALGDINVRMICLGASKHNFCFLVNGDAGKEAIKRLHSHFLEQ